MRRDQVEVDEVRHPGRTLLLGEFARGVNRADILLHDSNTLFYPLLLEGKMTVREDGITLVQHRGYFTAQMIVHLFFDNVLHSLLDGRQGLLAIDSLDSAIACKPHLMVSNPLCAKGIPLDVLILSSHRNVAICNSIHNKQLGDIACR